MCACVRVCVCLCVCAGVLTSGHEEVAVELPGNERLRETPQVLLQQTGHIMRIHISFQLHILTAVKTVTKLYKGVEKGGVGRRGEGRGEDLTRKPDSA